MLKKELKPISKRKDKLIRINQSDNYTESFAVILTPSEYSELIDIKNNFDDAKRETNDILTEKNQIQKESDIISAKNEELNKQLQHLNDELTTLKAKLEASESQVKNLEKKLDESKENEYQSQKDILFDTIIKVDEYRNPLIELKHLGAIDTAIRKKHIKIAEGLLDKINFQSLKDEHQKKLTESEKEDIK